MRLFLRSGFCLAILPLNLDLLSAADIVVLPAGSPISAKELCSSVRVIIGFAVISLTKALLAQLLSLVERPALVRVWVVPYSSHFRMVEVTVLLGTFNTREIVLYPSPDLPPHYSIDSSLDFMVEFLL